MIHSLLRGLALVSALFLLAVPAAAQTSDSLSLTGDVGLVNTSGNTDLTTINLGERVRWRRDRVTLAQTFQVVYGRSEGETTSSLWRAELRGDVALSDAVSAYAAAAYDRDRFAGIARRLTQGAGLAVGLIRRSRDRLEAESGLLLTQQRSTLETRDNFASGRAAAAYTHNFTEQTYVQQKVEGSANLEDGSDYRVTTESALVAPLSSRLALKITYVIRYDHQPEPGFRATDRLLTSGLQFTL